jgi:ubiquinone/menaquinone biosynthesis C-methylase UbiE
MDDRLASLDAQHSSVRRQFAVQAAHWGRDPIDADLRWAVERLRLSRTDTVLDVACGSGLLARAMAPRVDRVTAVDLTPEMLVEGQRAAQRDAIRNILFEEGTAEDLPYPDAVFDVVATRFSFHHFRDPAAALSEMARVCRNGGHVAVIDLVASGDSEVDARADRLETLRDPSHTRALTADELHRLFVRAGLEPIGRHERDVANEVTPWFERSRTPAAARVEILAAFDAELAGGPRSGMRPFRSPNGALYFLHRWLVAVARKSL